MNSAIKLTVLAKKFRSLWNRRRRRSLSAELLMDLTGGIIIIRIRGYLSYLIGSEQSEGNGKEFLGININE